MPALICNFQCSNKVSIGFRSVACVPFKCLNLPANKAYHQCQKCVSHIMHEYLEQSSFELQHSCRRPQSAVTTKWQFFLICAISCHFPRSGSEGRVLAKSYYLTIICCAWGALWPNQNQRWTRVWDSPQVGFGLLSLSQATLTESSLNSHCRAHPDQKVYASMAPGNIHIFQCHGSAMHGL